MKHTSHTHKLTQYSYSHTVTPDTQYTHIQQTNMQHHTFNKLKSLLLQLSQKPKLAGNISKCWKNKKKSRKETHDSKASAQAQVSFVSFCFVLVRFVSFRFLYSVVWFLILLCSDWGQSVLLDCFYLWPWGHNVGRCVVSSIFCFFVSLSIISSFSILTFLNNKHKQTGGMYNIELVYNDTEAPPRVRFLTEMWHPHSMAVTPRITWHDRFEHFWLTVIFFLVTKDGVPFYVIPPGTKDPVIPVLLALLVCSICCCVCGVWCGVFACALFCDTVVRFALTLVPLAETS